jgi:ABC-type branched-subunit amino acid transport system ATPase component/predicted MFS family arabinose efflux permease
VTGPSALTGLTSDLLREEPVGQRPADPAAPPLPITADGGSSSLGDVVRRYGAAPLLTLGSINLVDNLDRAAFITLAPDIRDTFGLSQAAINGINGVSAILVVAGALPFAVLADRGNRVRLVVWAAAVWSAFTLLTAVVLTSVQLTVVRILSGLGQAAAEPVHGSLIADYYPLAARGRAYGAHQAANPIGNILGPLLAGGIAALVGGTAGWRWAFVAMAPLGLAVALLAVRLKEPPRGAVDAGSTGGVDVPLGPPVELATGMRRLLAIPTLRSLYLGIGFLGFGLVSGPVLISQFFEEELGVGSFGRGAAFAIAGLGTLVGLTIGGVVGDRLFRVDPSWPLYLAGAGLIFFTVVTAATLYLPSVALVTLGLTVGNVGIGLVIAPIRQVVAVASPPALRALSFAMMGIFILLLGGFFGGIALGAIADATSSRTALVVLVIPGLAAGLLVARGTGTVRADIADAMAELAEAERARDRSVSCTAALLEIRNLDFRYGGTQVLFGVNLDVPEGEIVALLGTNGAGKSTLLRAVCGLDHPVRGSIRFAGEDITLLEAEKVLDLGITQMPGGKAVFPGLSVEENLLTGAFSFRSEKARIAADIAQIEQWFPILGQRRKQAAATLSGGEQQMLALSKAFLTRPRLLCIDELSLGLAPAVVEQLFGIVQEIHARGTTIIIVEQSLNVALALASTAVFMEKGSVRYTGPAADLLDRPDLLRSVFLDGAAR